MIKSIKKLFVMCNHKWYTYERRNCKCIHTGIHLWVDVYQSCQKCGKERYKKL